MARKALIGALVVMLIAAGASMAGSSKTGTAGAQELRIPVGSRGTAMGGVVVADATGCEAIYWNPAGIAKATATEAFFSYRGYIADMTVSYFSVVAPFSYGTIGVSAKILSLGDIIVTTERDWGGTGEVYSINVPVLGITYAKMLTDRVAFGATGMYLSEQVMQSKAQGIAFDFGFQYVPGWKTLKVGMVMKSYGPRMTYSGPDFEYSTSVPGDDPESANRFLSLTSASFEMPSNFQLGATYDISMGVNGKATVGTVFQSNNFSEDEYRLGAEYVLNDRLFVRGGYVICDQDGYIYGPTLGFGAMFNLGPAKASIDYSHTFISNYFDDIPELSLRFGL
ncbi:MAG: PorV/PorQ family protein [Candidatus Eisenbacteria bacterium]